MYIFKSFLISLAITKAYAATPTTTGDTSVVTGCHSHGEDIYCIKADGEEVLVSASSTPTTGVPAQYTGCHSHGSDTYCIDSDGNEALVGGEESTTDEHDHAHEESESSGEQNCHFHALRIGTLFVILVTSAIGVFAPMLLAKLPFAAINGVVMTIIKQFGTGIIIGTAFVHLYTHATLMFTNDCLGELGYEGTTSAIVMAGMFLSFLVEFIGHRIIAARESKRCAPCTDSEVTGSQDESRKDGTQSTQHATIAHLGHSHGEDPTRPATKFSVLVMEAGVLFHSILIGLTLVVAGDSFYKTLLVVIVFHQFFEGLALGARIAMLPGGIFPSKALMALAFSLITPIGMAIGLGVLNSFNGNEKSTLIALGTLDALSAGILVWVGVVDMWARDWVIHGGEMLDASLSKVLTGGVSFVIGLILMSVLGKWA